MQFPLNLEAYTPVKFDLPQKELTTDQMSQLRANIQLIRDSIVFFTAYANTKGLGGHTGGAYDIVPEMLILDGFMKNDAVHIPCFFRRGRPPCCRPIPDGGIEWTPAH